MKLKTIEEMCKDIVDSWDMDTLISYAVENMCIYYMDNPEEAEAQYKEFYN